MPNIVPVYPNGSEIAVVSTPNSQSSLYSRYRTLYRLTTTAGQTYIQTYPGFSIPTSPQDQFHYVSPGEENRLDLIAFNYYKLPQLWWVLATANAITDPLTIPVGTQLRIPSIHTLYQYGGILS